MASSSTTRINHGYLAVLRARQRLRIIQVTEIWSEGCVIGAFTNAEQFDPRIVLVSFQGTTRFTNGQELITAGRKCERPPILQARLNRGAKLAVIAHHPKDAPAPNQSAQVSDVGVE
jgi:hypothetical protein